ncbi:MAG: hypothetical protein ACLQMS_07240 [Desulfomonilaceae bacterium]
MLTIEQYNNLSSHINFARNDIETIMTKEPIAADGEFVNLIIDAKEHLSEVQDIIVFWQRGMGPINK